MKIYYGKRGEDGCKVWVADVEDRPGREDWRSLEHQVSHSPSGFEWGYGGSGPSDLARSILHDLLGGAGLYSPLYQLFKAEVIVPLRHDTWSMGEQRIRAWLSGRGAEQHAAAQEYVSRAQRGEEG